MYIELSDISEMATRISSFVRRTPLELHHGIWFKREDLQFTNSFTLRAALGILQSLSEEQRVRGLVLTTPGNLGWGLAHAMRALKLRIKMKIVLPEDAVLPKRSGLELNNCDSIEILVRGLGETERYQVVEEIANREGLLPLDLRNRKAEVAAKATVGLEIMDQLKLEKKRESIQFFCPVGSGALLAGCALVLKEMLGERVQIWGAEPKLANDFSKLFYGQTDDAKQTEGSVTLADSLRSPNVRNEYKGLLLSNVDEVMELTEAEILSAMERLYMEFGIVAEPSAAISFAAARKVNSSGGVCLITSGNVDKEKFPFYKYPTSRWGSSQLTIM